jgi:hypothetical protein
MTVLKVLARTEAGFARLADFSSNSNFILRVFGGMSGWNFKNHSKINLQFCPYLSLLSPQNFLGVFGQLGEARRDGAVHHKLKTGVLPLGSLRCSRELGSANITPY